MALREKLGFPPESREPFVVSRELLTKHFDRDVTAELSVLVVSLAR